MFEAHLSILMNRERTARSRKVEKSLKRRSCALGTFQTANQRSLLKVISPHKHKIIPNEANAGVYFGVYLITVAYSGRDSWSFAMARSCETLQVQNALPSFLSRFVDKQVNVGRELTGSQLSVPQGNSLHIFFFHLEATKRISRGHKNFIKTRGMNWKPNSTFPPPFGAVHKIRHPPKRGSGRPCLT